MESVASGLRGEWSHHGGPRHKLVDECREAFRLRLEHGQAGSIPANHAASEVNHIVTAKLFEYLAGFTRPLSRATYEKKGTDPREFIRMFFHS